MDQDIFYKVKKMLLDSILDDYTDVGYVGILESEFPVFSDDPKLEKEYFLQAISELLKEKKIRVGVLNPNANELFLNYWNKSDEKIIREIDVNWDSYFDQKTWSYGKLPTFDLTEEYARQIGKYKSDNDKLEKERVK